MHQAAKIDQIITLRELDNSETDFSDLTFDFSSCLSENLISEMDSNSLHMYDFVDSKVTSKPNKIGDHQGNTGLDDLDPSLELAVDLTEYIGNTGDGLFSDIFYQSQQVGTVQTPVQKQTESMPHIIQSVDNYNVTSLTPVVKFEPQQEASTLDLTSLLGGNYAVQIVDSGPSSIASPDNSNICFAEASSTIISPVPSPAPSTSSSYKAPSSRSRRKAQDLEKDTEDYKDRRARNNVAVRKSRDKAKRKQVETESRVKTLATDNERLQKKVDLLSKELNVLKGLFKNVSGALPEEFSRQLELLSQ